MRKKISQQEARNNKRELESLRRGLRGGELPPIGYRYTGVKVGLTPAETASIKTARLLGALTYITVFTL